MFGFYSLRASFCLYKIHLQLNYVLVKFSLFTRLQPHAVASVI